MNLVNASRQQHTADSNIHPQYHCVWLLLLLLMGSMMERQVIRAHYPCPEMNIDDNALEMGMDGIFGALKSPAIDNEVSNGRKRRQSTTPLSSTRGRKIKRTREELQEAGRSNTVDRNYSSIESIVDALQAVPDMDDELFLDACDLLEDEKKAKAFVKMDILHRKKWLLRNFRA